eukprot:CAMPEP_0184679718 /NCGR_PEP_ID=MMETSP0312-20130426/2567_1 /TAXON_ID=31354 /ORGANISM="Compsopogon coeruleus, Strain SAG 36.94" /LENGTH=62 /DNA_ID=CAMNT_0027129339 /DNA_START=477 /DNA_END=665 /DNA_ORIENTATION=-
MISDEVLMAEIFRPGAEYRDLIRFLEAEGLTVGQDHPVLNSTRRASHDRHVKFSASKETLIF